MKLIEKIKQGASWIWDKTNGGKTIAGIILHAGWFVAYSKFSPESFDFNQKINGHLYIGSLTATGGIHKIIKLLTKK